MAFDTDSTVLNDKQQRLHDLLRSFGRVAVAFSGGTDSTYLLAAAVDALGAGSVLAVTVASELIPAADVALAGELATGLGAGYHVLPFRALEVPEIAANPPDRCYHCKQAVLAAIAADASASGIALVLHGANRDDRGDYRPGRQAADELGTRAPLDEVGLSKAEIRELSRRRGLPTWDRPNQACLASRVPYGVPLTAEALRRIEAAEGCLRQRFGLATCRVRDHWPVARIEALAADWPALLSGGAAAEVVAELRSLGYRYVTLDLGGLRTGSMNEGLEAASSTLRDDRWTSSGGARGKSPVRAGGGGDANG